MKKEVEEDYKTHYENVTNNYVKKIFDNEPVYKRLKKQIRKGIKKYDAPVSPEKHSMLGWFNHLQEELTDGITYNELLMIKLEEVIESLKIAYKNSNDEITKVHILHALSILEDGDNNQ